MKHVFLFFCFLVYGVPVFAHPHVWVYTDLSIPVVSGHFDRIDVQWNFDEMYSTALLMESDTNSDGELSSSESEQLFKDVFSDLSTILPFMYFQLNGSIFEPKYFKNFKAWVGDDGSVYYKFSIPLEKEYAVGDYRIGFFDPSQYISFEQGLSIHFLMEDKSVLSCTSSLYRERAITLSYDGAHPEIYKVLCQ